VLGKIAFFETHDRADLGADRMRILPALLHHLQSWGHEVGITPEPGGTLGICFDAIVSGEKRFLKTHLAGAAAYASLAREADILFRLYGKMVVIDRFEFALANGTRRLCLLMAALTPLPSPMQPADADAIARACSEQLTDCQPPHLPTFEHYLASAAHALNILANRGFLSQTSATELQRLISVLEARNPTLPKALCHGDFGPKNIMRDGTELRVIDWEDCFLGVAGYDYLYWLTFMENRPFLQKAAFGRTGLAHDTERAILAVVVLLKSYLAVCSDAYLQHAVSPQVRMTEILELR
jgi:hypothetical protein